MSIAFTLSVVVGFARVAAPSHVPHHFHEWDAIDYYAKVHRLCETHIKNHRVRCTVKVWPYSRDNYKESEFRTEEFADVCGDKNWLAHFTGTMANKQSFTAVHLHTYDAEYIWESYSAKEPLSLRVHYTEWADSFGWYGISFRAIAATRQIVHPVSKEKLVSHEAVTFEGREALKLVTKWDRKTSTTHIARDTYQLLHQEYYDDPTKDTIMPDKVVTRMTYRDAGGKRYPATCTTTIHHSDGTTRKREEITFTEYAPYTPTSEDFDVKKRFGVAVPEHDARPPTFPPPPPEPIVRGPWVQREPEVRDSRIIDDPPPDHTSRYVIVAVVVVVLVIVLFFPLRTRRRV
jgi:hypothetical protein